MKNSKAVIPKIDIQDAVKQRIDSSINEYIIGKNRRFVSNSNSTGFQFKKVYTLLTKKILKNTKMKISLF